jgi:DNA replication and repair protein RecF
MAALSIRRLVLDNFRNYPHLDFRFETSPVVLVGENGAGKTNLLEAISLLAPGRGLRRAPLSELHRIGTPATQRWTVFYELQGKQGDVEIGTGSETETTGTEKRALRIDGKPARSQTALGEHVSLFWLTPEMDRLLSESASERRRFADRLTYVLDPAHNTRVNRYEDAMRSRARLLREGPYDDAWMNALEADMAREAVAIAAARLHWIEHLQGQLTQDPAPFPRLDLRMEGETENLLLQHSALDAEDLLRAGLKKNRTEDQASGTTALGSHRSDLVATHVDKNCPAALCSAGEQKALLISLALAQTRLVTQLQGSIPLLLLDDITAHLDEPRRDSLGRQILELGLQAWLSGTDASFFAALHNKAQFVQIHEGQALFL